MKGSVLALLEKPAAGQGFLYRFKLQSAVAGVSPAQRRVIKLPFKLRGRVDGRVNGTQQIRFPAHEAWKHHPAQA